MVGDVVPPTRRRDGAGRMAGMDTRLADLAAARLDRLLLTETVVWLSSVGADGLPHLVPVWFSWDGVAVLIASKPHAIRSRNSARRSDLIP